MGLSPVELYRITLYDYNRMADAYYDDHIDRLKIMRTHAWLVSIYSDLTGDARKNLTPEKMFPLRGDSIVRSDESTTEEWWAFFNRKVIKRETYN